TSRSGEPGRHRTSRTTCKRPIGCRRSATCGSRTTDSNISRSTRRIRSSSVCRTSTARRPAFDSISRPTPRSRARFARAGGSPIRRVPTGGSCKSVSRSEPAMGRISPQRRTWVMLLVALCLALTGAMRLDAQAPGDVAVVVHPDVPIDNLTLADLRRLLLGDREFWPASVRITLLIRAPIAHERDVVLKSVCQMTEAQFRQHWIAKVFRAETALAPKIAYSTEMAADLVNRIPGAITFIDASQVGRGLKVVKIDGQLPGQRGYPLH